MDVKFLFSGYLVVLVLRDKTVRFWIFIVYVEVLECLKEEKKEIL